MERPTHKITLEHSKIEVEIYDYLLAKDLFAINSAGTDEMEITKVGLHKCIKTFAGKTENFWSDIEELRLEDFNVLATEVGNILGQETKKK